MMTRGQRIWTAGIVLCLLAGFVGCGGDEKKDKGKDKASKDRAARHLDMEEPLPHRMAKDKDKDKDKDKGEALAQNAESYSRIVENAFRRTDKAPLSTFSIDVDTASYSNVRRFLTQETRLPP